MPLSQLVPFGSAMSTCAGVLNSAIDNPTFVQPHQARIDSYRRLAEVMAL